MIADMERIAPYFACREASSLARLYVIKGLRESLENLHKGKSGDAPTAELTQWRRKILQASAENMVLSDAEKTHLATPPPATDLRIAREATHHGQAEHGVRGNQRGEAAKDRCPGAVAVRYDQNLARMVVSLSSGIVLSFSPQSAQGLANAGPDDLADSEISPDGFCIHFPRIDVDLDVPDLLQGFLGCKRWMEENEK